MFTLLRKPRSVGSEQSFPRRVDISKVCRQRYGSSRGGVKNDETLIRLQEQIRASRGLPVFGGSQVDESIEGTKYTFKRVFLISI
jgi:hypothetical protein